MKKLIVCTFLFIKTVTCQAQLEVKINPLGHLFSSPDASIEFDVSQNLALEPIVGISYAKRQLSSSNYTSNGFNYGVIAKYYFSPVKGFDKLYMGAYARKGEVKYSGFGFTSGAALTNNYVTVGLTLGYKWVLKHNIVLDFATGIGRKVTDTYENTGSSTVNLDKISESDLDYVLRLGIGYRFF